MSGVFSYFILDIPSKAEILVEFTTVIYQQNYLKQNIFILIIVSFIY